MHALHRTFSDSIKKTVMSKYLELYYTFNAFKYNAVLALICISMYVLYSYTLH